ncbi:hypothetical protein Tco_1240622, partial [Tanacetum coccineum]
MLLTRKKRIGSLAMASRLTNTTLGDMMRSGVTSTVPEQQNLRIIRQGVLGYKRATSEGAELNLTFTKIEAHLLSPTGPRKFALTSTIPQQHSLEKRQHTRSEPYFSLYILSLEYKGETSEGADLNLTFTKIEDHLLSPTGPRKSASTSTIPQQFKG